VVELKKKWKTPRYDEGKTLKSYSHTKELDRTIYCKARRRDDEGERERENAIITTLLLNIYMYDQSIT